MSTAVAPVPDAPEAIADWPFRFEIVPLKYLVVDAYQRPLTSFVEKIEKKFNPALVGCLCVSKRSATKYAVIDGQTRSEGMKRRGMESAPCVVFAGLAREQEAALFALFQTERRGMTSAARFNAQVIAKDEDAVAIAEIVEGLGFLIDQGSAPESIKAVGAVEFLYRGASGGKGVGKKKDPELVAKTLETIKLAWPKLQDTAKSAVMIRGLGYFLSENPNTDLERLVTRLGKVQPSELARRAEAVREGKGMTGSSPTYMADAIEAVYKRTR